MVLKNSDMMTEDDEVFNCGSEVTCVSCHGLTYEGEIIAYDHGRRVMVIRCPSSLGQHSDVHLINLNNTTDVKVNKDVKKENTNSNPTSHLDTRKVEDRRKKAIEDRNRLVKAFDSGVSEEGLQLFQHLSRTFSSVQWDVKDIIVQKDVVVSPPYKADNCEPRVDSSLSGERRSINTAKTSEAVAYIKNVIDNYWNSKK